MWFSKLSPGLGRLRVAGLASQRGCDIIVHRWAWAIAKHIEWALIQMLSTVAWRTGLCYMLDYSTNPLWLSLLKVVKLKAPKYKGHWARLTTPLQEYVFIFAGQHVAVLHKIQKRSWWKTYCVSSSHVFWIIEAKKIHHFCRVNPFWSGLREPFRRDFIVLRGLSLG